MLILIRGCPGSGKSTYCRNHFPQFLHLENDMFHINDKGEYVFNGRKQDQAVQWCMDMTDLALSRGVSVVVSNTFTKRKYLNAYIRLAERYGVPYKVIRMTADFGNVHNVPKDVLENMKRGFEDFYGEEIVNLPYDTRYQS